MTFTEDSRGTLGAEAKCHQNPANYKGDVAFGVGIAEWAADQPPAPQPRTGGMFISSSIGA